MEITKFHRAAKIRAQRGPAPYSRKQVCRGNKTGINLHGRVGNNGRETGVHRRERKQRNTLSLSLSLSPFPTVYHRYSHLLCGSFAQHPLPTEEWEWISFASPTPLVFRSTPTPWRVRPSRSNAILSRRSFRRRATIQFPPSFPFPFPSPPSLAFHSTLFLRKHPVKLAFPTFFATLFSAESNTFPPSNRETNSKRAKRIFFKFRTFVYSGWSFQFRRVY